MIQLTHSDSITQKTLVQLCEAPAHRTNSVILAVKFNWQNHAGKLFRKLKFYRKCSKSNKWNCRICSVSIRLLCVLRKKTRWWCNDCPFKWKLRIWRHNRAFQTLFCFVKSIIDLRKLSKIASKDCMTNASYLPHFRASFCKKLYVVSALHTVHPTIILTNSALSCGMIKLLPENAESFFVVVDVIRTDPL